MGSWCIAVNPKEFCKVAMTIRNSPSGSYLFLSGESQLGTLSNHDGDAMGNVT